MALCQCLLLHDVFTEQGDLRLSKPRLGAQNLTDHTENRLQSQDRKTCSLDACTIATQWTVLHLAKS